MSDNLPAEIVAEARTIRIVDSPTYERAGGMLRSIKQALAQIAAKCRPVVDAAHKAHKEAVRQQKEAEAPWLDAERIIKTGMGDYLAEEERKRQALEAELRAKAAREAEEAQIREAIALEAAGAPEAADAVLDLPPEPVAVFVAPSVPKIAGQSVSERWHAEVVDLLALVKAVAEGRAAITFLEPNMPALNKQAQSLKRAMNLPGVKAVPETTISQRRA
jgi:hypothetical protein